jgi:peptidoglycan/LPS O-acetylase OafA/YrhL
VPVARFYVPELDGLRFFAFFAVFCFHSLTHEPDKWLAMLKVAPLARLGTLAVSAGWYGVELFFVLSSYLITELLLREKEALGSVDVRAFWARRILRIWPLYFAMIAFCALVLPRFVPAMRLPAVYVLGYVLFAGNWVTLLYGFPPTVCGALWSVSIEEQFYLAWPLVTRGQTRRGIGRLAIGLIVAGTCARGALHLLDVPLDAMWLNTFARLDAIGTGALLAAVLAGRRPRWPLGWRVLAATAAVTVLLMITSEHLRAPGSPLVFVLHSLPFASAAAATVVLAAVGGDPARSGLLKSAPLRHLGRISYGLYVVHQGVIALLTAVPVPFTAPFVLGRWIAELGLSVGLATLSYRYLERPFLRLKDRFTLVRSREAG